MGHKEGNAADGEAQRACQVADSAHPDVVVSPDGIQASVNRQLIQVAFMDDIPRVQDHAAVLHSPHHAPAEQAVGIGKDSDPDCVLIHAYSSITEKAARRQPERTRITGFPWFVRR